MTGPTGADQQTPDHRGADALDQALADQADLYAELAARAIVRAADVVGGLDAPPPGCTAADLRRRAEQPPDPPPPPGR